MRRAKRTATRRLTMKCGNCYNGKLLMAGETCGMCGQSEPSRKRQAKRSPARVSLQRRVGRSASDGQPEAVARRIGRKKAVQAGNPYYTILSPLMESLLRVVMEATKLAQRTEYKQGGDIVAFASDTMTQVNLIMDSQPGAASRRRQRAIPANAELTDGESASHSVQ